MSSFKHNKKKNTGLIQEWFARYLARSILDHRDADLAQAKKVVSRAFQPGSELAKEAVCFEALYQSRGKFTSREGAARLLERVRQACSTQNQAKLDQEKSALVSQIREMGGSDQFFDQQVRDYKTHVMIQVLLNHWRAVGTGNPLLEIKALSDVSLLEDQLLTYLSTKEVLAEDHQAAARAMEMTPGEIDQLVVKILASKVDKKFTSLLPEQKKLVNAWVFRDTEEKQLVDQLVKIRNSTIGLIEWSRLNEELSLGKGLLERLRQVQGLLQETYTQERLGNPAELSEEEIAFFLEVCDLRSELLGSGR